MPIGAANAAIDSSDAAGDAQTMIRVDKTKGRRKVKNLFLDDRGFPDVSDDYDSLLHTIDGGPILRTLKFPALISMGHRTLPSHSHTTKQLMGRAFVSSSTFLI